MALTFEFLAALALVYATNYFLIPSEKYGVPVLGAEIVSGIVFGAVTGALTPSTPGFELITSFAAIGLMLIMFEAGLELKPKSIKKHAGEVAEIGLATFFVPLLVGIGFGLLLDLGIFASVLIGITVSTTSLGLIHPLLEEYELLETEDGQIVLSVTVLNDVLSVLALAYAVAFTGSDLLISIASVTAAVIFFLYIAPFKLSNTLQKYLADTLRDHTVRFSMMALVGIAWIMEHIGVHAVLGSFFAGLLVSQMSHDDQDVNDSMRPVTNLAAPIFFFFVGYQIPVTNFPVGSLGLIGGVIAIGFGAKFVGAYLGSVLAGVEEKAEYMLIGAMPGRLSISVAAAEIGLREGIIQEPLYYSFIILSILSVFVSVALFRYVASGQD
ncbi:MAG: Kef-type K+ transport family [Candidatus Nanosalina sp. J07AB43]|nr:MAG: Kef-type K+ transport family [Candidatus Nanosalina sp. J07AB43]